MSGYIFFAVCTWLFVGVGVPMGFELDDDFEAKHYAMIFFWPVTVPIFMFFGVFYAIWAALTTSLSWFKK